jgi:hypothetical protein
MKTQEALKLALEALEAHADIGIKADKAITAIKEALREHAMREVQRLGQEIEQEPVAWMHIQGRHQELSHFPLDDGEISRGWEQYPLYTAPPQRKPLKQAETMEIANQTAGQYWMDEAHIQRFRVAVEAAHNIKENT